MSQNSQPNFSFPRKEIKDLNRRIGLMRKRQAAISEDIKADYESINKLLVAAFRDIFRGMQGASCEELTNRIFWIVNLLVTKYPKTTIRLGSFENDSGRPANIISNTGLTYRHDKLSPGHYIISDGRIIFNDVISGKKPELIEDAKKLLTAELKNNKPELEALKDAFEDIDSIFIEVSCYDVL